MRLRPYQAKAAADIDIMWATPGVLNVAVVLPTGGGKTVTFAHVVSAHREPCVVIAHRQELVSQISIALAREGVYHRIIAPKSVIKICSRLHMRDLGQSYYDCNASVGVAGVDTLIRRGDPSFERWCESVTLWVMDEAHHVLKDNIWGKAIAMLPNAKGLGATATPLRADGKGLGREWDGVFDAMVEGPRMRQLIEMGYLTDYRVVAPKTQDLDLSEVTVGATGDYGRKSLEKAVTKSRLTGDVVKEYKRFAMGKRGVTFATSIDAAQKICDEYNAQGVPARMVHGGTPDAERESAVAALASGEISNLVNVDIFGEGFDLPAIEVVSMARPTKSYGLYVQQFGRALRLLLGQAVDGWDDLTNAERLEYIARSPKPTALIIDHVGNTDTLAGGHGLPDAFREWSLAPKEKNGGGGQAADDVIPTRTCANVECLAVYERVYTQCPYCGTVPVRAQRSAPEHVDGDLTELSPETLAKMRGEVAEANKTPEEYNDYLSTRGMHPHHQRGAVKKYEVKYAQNQLYQGALQASMEWWSGVHKAHGLNDREIMRKFYYTFGVDGLTAQGLDAADAHMLADKINHRIGRDYPC